MLVMAPGKMAQAATEIPEGRTFSGIDYSGVTVASSWSDEGKYDQAFYSKIESEYENAYTTADTALEIGTAAELAAFAKFVKSGENVNNKNSHGFENKFVCLTNDIDLQGAAPMVDYQNDGDDGFKVVLTGAVSNNWVPIVAFYGTFDGNCHSILGMVIKADVYAGLFGSTSSATIQNVGVKNSVVIAAHTTGSIVGGATNSTIIQNCYATGEIYASYDGGYSTSAGGILGYSEEVTVKNCYSSCDIFAISFSTSSTWSWVGGILGENGDFNNGSTIESCYSSASKLYAFSSGGKSRSGGLVGNGFSCNISNSYYDQDAAPGISASGAGGTIDAETVKGLTTAEFKQKLTEMVDENGDKMWFLAPGILDPRKTLRSSDFTFTLPDDLDYDGQGKVITIKPKDGITGIGAVTVKYYKVNSNGTLGAASTTPPTDAGRYKVKFDVSAGSLYAQANDFPAMF